MVTHSSSVSARLTSSSRFVPFFRGVDRLSDPSGLPVVHQTPTLDTRAIVWLDIDHTLYGRAQGREISRLMKDRIHGENKSVCPSTDGDDSD